VNHEEGIVIVNQVHHLQKPAASPVSAHQPFVIALFERIGRLRSLDNHLRFFGINSMFADMVCIPFYPSEAHGDTSG
jgi:hypothetical protein